jgi:hypothetical protein
MSFIQFQRLSLHTFCLAHFWYPWCSLTRYYWCAGRAVTPRVNLFIQCSD